MTSRPSVPSFIGLQTPGRLLQKSPLLNSKPPASTFRSIQSQSTRRSPPRMALPSLGEIRAAKFPKTVEQASKIFQSIARSGPLGAPQLPLLSTLASNSHGARGLFVALLSDPNVTLADSEPIDPTFITMLATAEGEPEEEASVRSDSNSHGEYIRSLAIKNIVMPAAMVFQYRQDGQSELMENSVFTRDRAIRVAAAWHTEDESRKRAGLGSLNVCDNARDMKKALEGNGGIYESFVRKWGYGEDQRSVMVAALRQAFGSNLD